MNGKTDMMFYHEMSRDLTRGLDYRKYVLDNSLHTVVDVDLESYGSIVEKRVIDPYFSVDPNNKESFPPELDDLCRLHWLVVSRKVTTILEFGVGKSTLIFDDALKKNKASHDAFVKKNLRRGNPWECHSLDNYQSWIDEVKANHELDCVVFHKSDVSMGTFNDRVCTYYDDFPNVCPDFIYLDGPDQFSTKGNIRGITTGHVDRLPMVADILAIEHFLLPGTLIVTDGRTANARFLKSNLQRDWLYCYDVAFDQHYFELCEVPLGVFNKRQIDFCLGDGFYSRLKHFN